MGTLSTLALKKALADSKLDGVNVGLKVDSSDQVPSMSDLEQYLTALARSTHSVKVMGSSFSSALTEVISPGLSGVAGV